MDKKLLIAFLTTLLVACGTLPAMSSRAAKVQVHEQSSAIVAGCKKLSPIEATVSAAQMAQLVYESAIAEARDKAAAAGGDSLVLLNSDHQIKGLTNTITVHAVALRCY